MVCIQGLIYYDVHRFRWDVHLHHVVHQPGWKEQNRLGNLCYQKFHLQLLQLQNAHTHTNVGMNQHFSKKRITFIAPAIWCENQIADLVLTNFHHQNVLEFMHPMHHFASGMSSAVDVCISAIACLSRFPWHIRMSTASMKNKRTWSDHRAQSSFYAGIQAQTFGTVIVPFV